MITTGLRLLPHQATHLIVDWLRAELVGCLAVAAGCLVTGSEASDAQYLTATMVAESDGRWATHNPHTHHTHTIRLSTPFIRITQRTQQWTFNVHSNAAHSLNSHYCCVSIAHVDTRVTRHDSDGYNHQLTNNTITSSSSHLDTPTHSSRHTIHTHCVERLGHTSLSDRLVDDPTS